MQAIEISGLSKKFERFQLKNIDLTVPGGSIMGLIGENGAGKTTTIKLLLNQLHADSGEIRILGLDHKKEEKVIKNEVGVVFDESYFHENIKPTQISRVMSHIYTQWDESLFTDYLNRFQVPADKVTKELSRGTKMKLSIATALAHHPKLLILDEATSGLDPVIRNEILDLLLEFIQDEDHSVLLSSHITGDLEKIADYITFLHNGEVVFSESKDDLLYDYGLLLCGAEDFKTVDAGDIIGHRKNRFGHEILIKNKEQAKHKYKGFTIDSVSLEEIMLFYIREEDEK